MLRPQHFYNIFTTNSKRQIIIDSNLELTIETIFLPISNNLLLRISCEDVKDISFL